MAPSVGAHKKVYIARYRKLGCQVAVDVFSNNAGPPRKSHKMAIRVTAIIAGALVVLVGIARTQLEPLDLTAMNLGDLE
jgi:hypothetical protein